MKRIHLDETDSTNNYLRESKSNHANEDLLITTDFQTSGRGQKNNTWESAKEENLLFSFLIHPTHIVAHEQFCISEAISLAIQQTLLERTRDVKIKWPNDIYIGNHKVCGILVENSLVGSTINDCIIGCGVNINQDRFFSDAPNPVSLRQATGQEWNREQILTSIMRNFDHFYSMTRNNRETLHSKYLESLYRRGEEHLYSDANGEFRATIIDVAPSGLLTLRDSNGTNRKYAFKEVRFV